MCLGYSFIDPWFARFGYLSLVWHRCFGIFGLGSVAWDLCFGGYICIYVVANLNGMINKV